LGKGVIYLHPLSGLGILGGRESRSKKFIEILKIDSVKLSKTMLRILRFFLRLFVE
jgi:hypothetical protein